MSLYLIKIIIQNSDIQFRKQYVFVRGILFLAVGCSADRLSGTLIQGRYLVQLWIKEKEYINHCPKNCVLIKRKTATIIIECSALTHTCTASQTNPLLMIELLWKFLLSPGDSKEKLLCFDALCLEITILLPPHAISESKQSAEDSLRQGDRTESVGRSKQLDKIGYQSGESYIERKLKRSQGSPY